jgi:hypothetical protein
MLSHAVLRVIHVFPSFVMLSLDCVFMRVLWYCIHRDVSWPWWGSMLWFEQWLKRWRWLILSWHVVLESAKERIWGVDTPGQHVPPCVRYGTAYLLIRNAIGCVLLDWVGMCIILWDILSDLPEPHGVRGALCWGILSTTSGALCWRICSKAWYTPLVDLCQHHAVISRPYTKGSVKNGKRRFFSHRRVMKSLLVGTGHWPLQSVQLSW